jgi:cellulose biosynthesis protein BcsQ
MTPKAIAFFNNKGGVGKTTLVYHMAWMYRELGKKVLVADLDPQANVTSMFLDEETMDQIFSPDNGIGTIFSAFKPLIDGTGDIALPKLQMIARNLFLIPGDLNLSAVEDELSTNWPKCLDEDQRAFRVISALWRIIEAAAKTVSADVILIDVGPNLGSLNRAALICADEVVVPLAPDLYSLQGLRNLGPRLRKWRSEWKSRLGKANASWNLSLPRGEMRPIGYVVLQHAVRADRPVQAYMRWMDKIPPTYAEAVLDEFEPLLRVESDKRCLAMLKNYRSLMPLSQEAHKPMFLLKASDGALGSHTYAVQSCYDDFKQLVKKVEKNSASN